VQGESPNASRLKTGGSANHPITSWSINWNAGSLTDAVILAMPDYLRIEMKDVILILDHPRVDGPTLLLRSHVLREGKQVDRELKLETKPS
jgi:hypothetical protein